MKQNLSCKIIIASHKICKVPSDALYLPLLVGSALQKEQNIPKNWKKDNTGDNISTLNPYFCELTGLFWAWKNLNFDYIGLVHYRRFFSFKKNKKDYLNSVLAKVDLDQYLGKIKVFVPNKRRYFIETLYNQYSHNHYHSHLDVTRTIISDKYPEYLSNFDEVMNRRWGYMFNMMIMDKSLLNNYCNWLFDILFELQNRISPDGLSPFQARFYGRVSERIFNVWLKHQLDTGKLDKSQIKEIPCVHIEKVKWINKISVFLKAKFLGIKPKHSL